MSVTEKLLAKLRNGTITGLEAETLLGKMGWARHGGKGSHSTWTNGVDQPITLVKGRIDLKPYQIKMLKAALLKGE